MAGFSITDCTAQRAPGRLIRRIDRLMRGLVDERLAAVGIGYPAWATLKLVREGVVGTATDLGRELGYTSGAATRLIDGLEARGLLARDRDRADRRVVRLRVTPDGEALADRGMPIAVGVWNEMIAGFDQAEADRFVQSLVKLQATIDAHIAARDATPAEAAE